MKVTRYIIHNNYALTKYHIIYMWHELYIEKFEFHFFNNVLEQFRRDKMHDTISKTKEKIKIKLEP